MICFPPKIISTCCFQIHHTLYIQNYLLYSSVLVANEDLYSIFPSIPDDSSSNANVLKSCKFESILKLVVFIGVKQLMILGEKVEDSSLDNPSVIEDLHDLGIADLGKEFAFRVEDFDFIFLGDIDCQIDL
jgi:hypothetical protein